jgi:hypothetical protein
MPNLSLQGGLESSSANNRFPPTPIIMNSDDGLLIQQ